MDYLQDINFLDQLCQQTNKIIYSRIIVLDNNDFPIQTIEGKIISGNVNIDGFSSVRRTASLTLIADNKNNDLTNVNNILSLNKKIKIEQGIKNNIDLKYDNIIWFSLGVFIIQQAQISQNLSGITINLSCKDKMCLLNGENGGTFPTSITFSEYDQTMGYLEVYKLPEMPNDYTIYKYNNKFFTWSITKGWVEEEREIVKQVGKSISVRQRIYDIIQTVVCNYGHEPISNIYISDIPLELKQLVRWTGNGSLYYNSSTNIYTTNVKYIKDNEKEWKEFKYNEDVGYIYTDFVYPGELITNIGDNVCTVLDSICNALGNYTYYYDVNGAFIFEERKNYLNNSYNEVTPYRLDNSGREIIEDKEKQYISLASDNLYILDNLSYKVDFNHNQKIKYNINENSKDVISITNSPDYTNIKNDYHIWGKNGDGAVIHYHLALKNKPKKTYMNEYGELTFPPREVVPIQDEISGEYTGQIRLKNVNDLYFMEDYIPNDWRAELYLQGLEAQAKHQRPDVWQQELLDLFDSIYDFNKNEFKINIVKSPNDLNYFIDYIEPNDSNMDYTVDNIGQKTYTYQYDKISKLFNVEVPNVIILNMSAPYQERQSDIKRCELEGTPYSNVDEIIYNNLAIGTIGYSAEEKMRDALYQYTNYNEPISLQMITNYNLDVDSIISVNNRNIGVNGTYSIKSISLPLDPKSSMTVSAVKALNRI